MTKTRVSIELNEKGGKSCNAVDLNNIPRQAGTELHNVNYDLNKLIDFIFLRLLASGRESVSKYLVHNYGHEVPKQHCYSSNLEEEILDLGT